MHALTRKVAGLTSIALVAFGTAGCNTEPVEHIDPVRVSNRADADVRVRFGDEATKHLAPKDGVAIYGDMVDCYEGPIVVTYADESTVELEDPICGGQTLVVLDATARVVDNTDAP